MNCLHDVLDLIIKEDQIALFNLMWVFGYMKIATPLRNIDVSSYVCDDLTNEYTNYYNANPVARWIYRPKQILFPYIEFSTSIYMP